MIYKVGIYCRLSKEDGDKEVSDSIDNQLSLIQNYIQSNDTLLEVDIYIDDGYTGLNFDRPSFKRMMEDVYSGKINTIITKDMSRLGREHIETSNYIEKIFPTFNVRYVAILDNYDTLIGSNQDIAPFKSLINDMYSKDISKKVRGALDTKRNRGEFIGAFAPYGYKKDPKNNNKLIIDEYAANIVKRVFQMYVEGIGKLAIARRLNEEGLSCPTKYKQENGGKYHNANKLRDTSYWTYSTISRMLKNEVYIGHMVQKKQQVVSYKINKHRVVPKSEQIKVEYTHEPIIDIETFELVQKLSKVQKRKLNFDDNVTMFAGLLKCADCGRRLSKTINRYKGVETVYYKCGTYKQYGKEYCTSHSIREDSLVLLVLNSIRSQAKKALRCDDIDSLLKMQPTSNNMDNMECEKLKDKLSGVSRYKQKLLENYTDEIINKEEYLTFKQDYDKQECEIKNQIKVIEDRMAKQTSDVERIKKWRESFINYIDIEELDRVVLTSLVDTISVKENQVIKINYRPQSPI